MRSLLRRLQYVLRQSRHEQDLREEMETHRSLRAERLEREGMTMGEAAQASRRAFGNATTAREDSRGVWLGPGLEHVLQELRLVVRSLRKSPTFTAVTVLTLALGIGANTALFSVFNSLLLRSLPVRDPGTLVNLEGSLSYPVWEAIRERGEAIFDGAFAWADVTFDLSRGGPTETTRGAYASGETFEVLGLVPARGRLLSRADDRPDANAAVAVISYRLWEQRFGRTDTIVGMPLSIQRAPFTIVGVLPEDFSGLDIGRATDVVVPFAAEPVIRPESRLRDRLFWWTEISARLKPGQSVESANAALVGVQPQIREVTMPVLPPSLVGEYLKEPFKLKPGATGRSALRDEFDEPLRVLIAAVAMVLLVACANLASMFLARALSRRQELSLRLALGASRWRLSRFLLLESLVVSAIGATLGLAIAHWGGTLLVRQLDTWRGAVSLDLTLDWRVLSYAAGLATLTALVAGLVPALSVREVSPADALKDASRTVGDSAFRMRGVMLVAQVAISLTLVVAAAFFLRTFTTLTETPLGFSPEDRTVVTLNLAGRNLDQAGRAALIERVRQALSSLPAAKSVAVADLTPLSGLGWMAGTGAGQRRGPPDPTTVVWRNATSPGWFKTMNIPLIEGRDFDTHDGFGAESVAIVNQSYARKYLTGGPPLGRLVRFEVGDNATYRVVGVVGDSVYDSLREGMLPTFYIPEAQRVRRTTGDASFLVWAQPGALSATEPAIADVLRQADPTLTFTFRRFDALVRANTTQERLVAFLSAMFGGLALVLAGVGLYGVIAQTVQARRSEIGIRVALGARSGAIVAAILRRVAVLVGVGVAIGVALSLWGSRFVQALLFNLDARDPVTIAAAVGVLVVVSLVATSLPVLRALRLSPAEVLREG